MRKRLEKLEMEAGRVRRFDVYWVDPSTGARELIARVNAGFDDFAADER
jgi:hypothetical protein